MGRLLIGLQFQLALLISQFLGERVELLKPASLQEKERRNYAVHIMRLRIETDAQSIVKFRSVSPPPCLWRPKETNFGTRRALYSFDKEREGVDDRKLVLFRSRNSTNLIFASCVKIWCFRCGADAACL